MGEILNRKTSQDLSAAALSATLDFEKACKLLAIYFHFDAAVTETITITFISADGTSHSTVVDTKSLSAETDYVYQPNGAVPLNEGDSIKVECTNATATATVGVTGKAEV